MNMEDQEFVRYRNPIEYLKVFFRRKWLFITPVFIGFVFSIVACFLLPPTYESSTVILVEEEKIINPLIQGLAVSTSVAQRMSTLKEQILGWRSLVELSHKLKLAERVKNQGQFEELIANLRKNIVVQMRGPNLIKLSFRDPVPEKAQVVTQTLTDIFVDENMRSQTKEADVAINFIKEQLQVYKKKIKESEIADKEEQLKALLLDSTENHPMVKELKQKIEMSRKQLDAGNYQVSGAEQPVPNPLYESLKQELDKMTAPAQASVVPGVSNAYAMNSNNGNEDPNSSIYKLILMDKLDAVMARDMRVNENIYNMLLQKLETAKITQRLEASKEGTRYTIIDPPRLPLKPAKPNKIMVIFLGLFMGSFSGAGLVLGREFMDHSFLDIEDAKENLELPVLGAISRLTTQEEIERQGYRKKKWMITLSVSSALLVITAMLIAFLKK